MKRFIMRAGRRLCFPRTARQALLTMVVGLTMLPAASAATELSGPWEFRYSGASDAAQTPETLTTLTSGWTQMQVPGSFDQAIAGPQDLTGIAWYRRRLSVHLVPRTRMVLKFGGVAFRAAVWINGHEADEHGLPYLPFAVEATRFLHEGENTVLVQVDNRLLPDSVPDERGTGWWNFGGILRPVTLEVLPARSIQAVSVSTTGAEGAWSLHAQIQLSGRQDAAGRERRGSSTVRSVLTDEHGQAVVSITRETDQNGRLVLDTPVPAAQSWSPEAPHLYHLTVEIESIAGKDRQTVPVGFRTIQVRDTRIALNGKTVLLRGIDYHQMFPGLGMTLPVEQIRSDLLRIKAAGANLIRSHYELDAPTYDLCDELGLMVWSEIPAWQTATSSLAEQKFWTGSAQPMLDQTMRTNGNHPSVVIWSVANEIPSDTPEGKEYIRRATAYVKQVDPTRLVTFASDRREDDISFAPVDFIAVNEYYGWYYGQQQDVGPMLDRLHQKWPNKPLVVSEMGADAMPGLRGSVEEKYTEDFQAAYLQTHLGQALAPERRPFVSGAMIWVFADFPFQANLAYRNLPAPRPPGISGENCKGLVSDRRVSKLAYRVVQQAFLKVAAESHEAQE